MSNLPVLPPQEEWAQMKELSAMAFKSQLLPSSIKSQEAALIIQLKGRELGMSPMTAYANIYIVNGRPGISSEMLLALVRRDMPAAKIQFTKSTDTICEIKSRRPDEDFDTITTYTIDDAKRAGLLGKDNWKNYPTDMLRARAIGRMKRMCFPEIAMGVSHTPDELIEDSYIAPNLKDVGPAVPVQEIKPSKLKNHADDISNPSTVAVETKQETIEVKQEKVETKKSRKDLGSEITQYAKKISPVGFTKYVSDKVGELFQKSPGDLTDEEMVELISYLQIESEKVEVKK